VSGRLTIEEVVAIESIRSTLSAYHLAGDRGRTQELVEQFTPEGVLELSSGRFVGRTAILERLSAVGRERPAGDETPAGALPFLHHHLTTSHVELTGPGAAAGHHYFLVMSPIGVDHCGRYTDTYAVHEGRWLIAHRKVTVSWAAPDSIVGARPVV
jgi:hypothetical protein